MFASRQLAVPLATVLKGLDRYLALIGKGHQTPGTEARMERGTLSVGFSAHRLILPALTRLRPPLPGHQADYRFLKGMHRDTLQVRNPILDLRFIRRRFTRPLGPGRTAAGEPARPLLRS